MQSRSTVKVTVDKSHLLTLGERMYVESVELVRELVANAYDADASEVQITIAPDAIVIEDDGSGMDARGLEQFFTIGSEEKRVRSTSPRFGRKRIGQFGIGKFAALAIADEFRIETKRRGWVYSVVFNREAWRGSASWELPIVREPATPLHYDGTKVTLTRLRKQLSPSEVERFLRESIPLHAKRFAVYVNGNRIAARFVPGKRVPIRLPTVFGLIEGEMVIAALARDVTMPGIECRARQVLIRRELFGLDREYGREIRRLTGSVNTDFLPVTAGRDDFIRDSAEFQLFSQVMRGQVETVLKALRRESTKRTIEKISSELRDALDKIRIALTLNPDLTPSGSTIVRRRKRGEGIVASTVSPSRKSDEGGKIASVPEEVSTKDVAEAGEETSRESPKPRPQVIRKIRIAKLGISVGVVSLGANGPEVISEGNAIYVNLDHPLYDALSRRRDQFSLHLLRIIAQEVVLMKKLRLGAREAFEMQSKLLTDAVVGEKKGDDR